MDVVYRINPGWTYEIDKTQGFVIAPSGESAVVELRSIDILRAIESGSCGFKTITAFMKNHSRLPGFIVSDDSGDGALSEEDMMNARIEECLNELIEIGVISPYT